MPACSSNLLERIQRWATKLVIGIIALRRETAVTAPSFIAAATASEQPDYRYSRVSMMRIRTCFFLPPTRHGLRGHPYKVLQGASHRRRRGSAFSVRVVKYWNKLPISVVTAPSVSVFKKRFEKVWTEIFPHLPHWLNTHLPISPPPHTICTPPINSYHLYVLPNSLLYIRVVSLGPFYHYKS